MHPTSQSQKDEDAKVKPGKTQNEDAQQVTKTQKLERRKVRKTQSQKDAKVSMRLMATPGQ